MVNALRNLQLKHARSQRQKLDAKLRKVVKKEDERADFLKRLNEVKTGGLSKRDKALIAAQKKRKAATRAKVKKGAKNVSKSAIKAFKFIDKNFISPKPTRKRAKRKNATRKKSKR